MTGLQEGQLNYNVSKVKLKCKCCKRAEKKHSKHIICAGIALDNNQYRMRSDLNNYAFKEI